MSNGLDGHTVDEYAGRFTGTFELEFDDGEIIKYDDIVSFVVHAKAGKASFGTNKHGDLKRTNIFEVESVKILPLDKDMEEVVQEVHVMGSEEPIVIVDGETVESNLKGDVVSESSFRIHKKDSNLNDFLYPEGV